MKVFPLHPLEISDNWSTVEPLLSTALSDYNAEDTLDSLRHALQSSYAQLWRIYSNDGFLIGVFVTHIAEVPTRSVCRVLYASGERMEEWVKLADETAETFARKCGCSAIEVHGRAGWKKLLKADYVGTVLRRSL